jgi:hypothetical protein
MRVCACVWISHVNVTIVQNLVKQCEYMEIPFIDQLPDRLEEYDVRTQQNCIVHDVKVSTLM